MTTDGQTTFSSIPLSDGYPNAIGAGPDGNVWFTLDDEATIGRITPAGAITEFPVSHPDGDYVILGGIATVSATTLAFTYQDIVTGESRIGRVTRRAHLDDGDPHAEQLPPGDHRRARQRHLVHADRRPQRRRDPPRRPAS
jgi:virginiamycin B lyase